MNKQQVVIPKPLDIPKIPSLDGLRAISISFVILFHVFFSSNLADLKALGRMGVEIFFVISGFLITTLLLKEKSVKSKINLKKFYLRRALRILPVVILFLAALFFLNRIFQLQITNRSFVTAFFFLKNLPIPNTDDWYTAHFWSLATEEQFYIIFPFLIAYLSIKSYKRLVISLIIILTIVNYCFYNKVGPFYSNRIIHVISMLVANFFSMGTVGILVGSLLSVLAFDNPNLLNKLLNVRSFFLSSLLFLIALLIRIPFFHLYIPYFSQTLFAGMIGVIIILNLNVNTLMARILNWRFMTEIGVLSYSLYVWQQIFTYRQPWAGAFKHADSIILNLMGLFLVAYLSYRFYEKKFLDFKARFKIVV